MRNLRYARCIEKISFKMQLEQKLQAYSMIEISISMIAISILCITLAFFQHYYHKQNIQYLTHSRQVLVMKALGQYANTHSCLPYPCLKEQYHQGLQQSPTISSLQSSIQATGYIPWKTLGIPQEMTLDGNNKPMIYVMNPLLGERTDFTPFPDTFLQTYTTMKNQYSFFLMNDNNVLDIVSENNAYNFIQLQYHDKNGEMHLIDMTNATSRQVHLFKNIIERNQTELRNMDGRALGAKPEGQTYETQGEYLSPYLDIKLTFKPLHTLDYYHYDASAPGGRVFERSDPLGKWFICYKYNMPPITKHTIRNCIAYVIMTNEDQRFLKNTTHTITITLNAPGSKNTILYSTRFDIHLHHGPLFHEAYINGMQAGINLTQIEFNLEHHIRAPNQASSEDNIRLTLSEILKERIKSGQTTAKDCYIELEKCKTIRTGLNLTAFYLHTYHYILISEDYFKDLMNTTA